MKLLRKRYIPNEIIDISKDEVIYQDDELIVTKWLPINKRNDIGSGISYSYIKEGYKISKFFDNEEKFLYWYCDIINYDYNIDEDTHTFIDLLVDLKIYEDGRYEILDLDELVEAHEQNLITFEDVLSALKKLNKLLEMVKNNKFPPEDNNKHRE